MLEIQVDFSSLEKYLNNLENNILSNFRGFWQQDGQEALEDAFEEVFAKEGNVDGYQSWARLSPPYARWKNQHHPNKSILVLSGRLRGSLTKNPVVTMNPREMIYTSNVPYAKYHEHGTDNMPQRSIFDRAASVAPRYLERAANRYLMEKL